MKKGLIVIGLVVIMAIAVFACSSPASKSVSWEVPIDKFTEEPHITGDQVEVPVGGTFILKLGSNPTTGFSWSEEAQISDTTVLKQLNHEYIAPDSGLAGAAGQEIWTFEAVKKGGAVISLEYSRPWEGGEKAEWTYTVTVTVK